MSPNIPDETMEEVKQEVEMKAKTPNSFVFQISKDYISDFFTYGKPPYIIAKIVCRQLALDLWGLTEEEVQSRKQDIIDNDEYQRSEIESNKIAPYFECRCDKDPRADVWQVTIRKKDWRL